MKESVSLTQDLVQIESASENEEEVIRYAQNWFENYNVPSELDAYQSENDRGEEITMYNLEVGDVENSEMIIAAHLDTVEFDEGNWEESEPLSGEITEGKLYGRGSADTKSNAAAAMVAVRNAYERFERPNVALVLESDEEKKFRGAERFLSRYENEDIDAEFCVMCEPEDLDIITAHNGLYHANVDINRELDRTHGSKVHMVDEEGEVYQPEETAIQEAIPVLQQFEEVGEYMRNLEPDEEMGPVTFATTIVDGGKSNNVLPQDVRIETDSRIPKNYDPEELASKVEEMIQPVLQEDDELEFESVHEAFVIDREDPYVQEFFEAAEEAGAEPEFETMRAYTELGLYHNRLGIPGVIFGTSPNEVIHNPDEYVDVETIPVVQKSFENMIETISEE